MLLLRSLRPYLIGVPLGLAAWTLIVIAATPFLPSGGPIAVYAWAARAPASTP